MFLVVLLVLFSPFAQALNAFTRAPYVWGGKLLSTIDAKRGQCPGQVISCVAMLWRTHQGGSASRVSTERSLGTSGALGLV